MLEALAAGVSAPNVVHPMVALNLAHEIVESGANAEELDAYAARISHLNDRIEESLGRYTKKELN